MVGKGEIARVLVDRTKEFLEEAVLDAKRRKKEMKRGKDIQAEKANSRANQFLRCQLDQVMRHRSVGLRRSIGTYRSVGKDWSASINLSIGFQSILQHRSVVLGVGRPNDILEFQKKKKPTFIFTKLDFLGGKCYGSDFMTRSQGLSTQDVNSS